MRAYIFTAKELAAIEQFTQTGKRNPTVNKLLYYIRRNERLLVEIQLFLELWSQARGHSKKSVKRPPGRPRKN
ncbi:MAG: hypothetical protein QXL10_05255 [Candidatus Bathyarchaeia archaeon]